MAQGFDGPTVRYWLLATHYRTVLHYSLGELQRAAQCVSRLNEFVARLGISNRAGAAPIWIRPSTKPAPVGRRRWTTI